MARAGGGGGMSQAALAGLAVVDVAPTAKDAPQLNRYAHS